MTCGIYCISNNKNAKCYIGQSYNIEQRFREHKSYLRLDKRDNIKLRNAWKKYGESAFQFIILEECKRDKKVLTKSEQFWMDNLKFIGLILYNMCPATNSCLGNKLTDEHKKHISDGCKGRPAWNKNIPHTLETINKMKNSSHRKSYTTILKKEEVIEIINKKKSKTILNISKEYKVSESTIKNIIYGRTWNKITGIKQRWNKKHAKG